MRREMRGNKVIRRPVSGQNKALPRRNSGRAAAAEDAVGATAAPAQATGTIQLKFDLLRDLSQRKLAAATPATRGSTGRKATQAP